MNINASIIDQRVAGIVEDHGEWLPQGSDLNKKSQLHLYCYASQLALKYPWIQRLN